MLSVDFIRGILTYSSLMFLHLYWTFHSIHPSIIHYLPLKSWLFCHTGAAALLQDPSGCRRCLPKSLSLSLVTLQNKLKLSVIYPDFMTIKLYNQCESCVWIRVTNSSTFSLGVGLFQGSPSSPILFLIHGQDPKIASVRRLSALRTTE